MKMRHHKSCRCEKCDTGEPRPYPVSKYPIYENPHVMMPNVNHQPGDNQGPVVSSIQEAFLSAAPCLAFQQLLRQQPDLINEVGFNGQLPIHKAALRGDPVLIETLIKYGANMNARTNFQETPLHFACKRGNPRVVHMLIEAGADVEAVDKSGKGTVHHAAQGGSVLVLHYLSEVCAQDFNHRDFFFILPLHLAALHGHKQALQYLTRKGRSDVFSRDGQENNVLHLAAQGGHDALCWTLLEEAGIGLLHQQNNLGFTPLDVAKMGKNPKQREMVSWLGHYAKQSAKPSVPGGGPVRGPVAAWWCHLLLAPLFYPILLIFTQLFPQKGWVMVVGLATMAYTMYGHGHRMNHVCRWPNPIHAGTFAAGLLHTIICGVIEVLPYVYFDFPKFICFMMVQSSVMLYMYYILLTRNPGVIRNGELKEGLNEEYSIRDIALGLIRNESLCPDCEIVPPPRSHHCKLCNLCYHDLDHHCLFLYNCVARNNHRMFVLFIMLVQVCMIEFVLMALVYFMKLHPHSEGLWDSIMFAFIHCPWVGSLVLMNVGSLGWGITLLRYQLDVIMYGHTTAYRPAMGRNNLTWQQRMQNLLNFLKGRRVFIVGSPEVIT